MTFYLKVQRCLPLWNQRYAASLCRTSYADPGGQQGESNAFGGRKTLMSDSESGVPAQGEPGPATQDDLNRIVADRVSREKANYADYDQLKAAAEELARLKDAEKTDLERQAEELAKVTAERDSLALERLRRRVADAKELPRDAFELVSGSTEDEVTASVEKLLALITKAPRGPRPDPSQGRVPQAAAGGDWLRDRFKARS
jgi:hypothetical protein